MNHRDAESTEKDDFYAIVVKDALLGGRFRRLFWFFWCALAVALGTLYLFVKYVYYPAPNLPHSEKRVLEWGWHTPDLQDIPQYLETAQNLPFDGLIFDIATPEDTRGLAWTLYGNNPVDRLMLDTLATQFADFKWGRLTDNFLRVNFSPANVDWFDDYSVILNNLTAVAGFAKEIGFRGIMLDTEQYGDMQPFNYEKQLYREEYSYGQYDAQAYLRGQEVIQAFNASYPGLTILYTFALSLGPITDSSMMIGDKRYDLLIPFLNGMIAAADGDTQLVDAFEASYTYREAEQFKTVYSTIHEAAPDHFAVDKDRYRQYVQAGFGLWLDHNYCNEPGLKPVNCPSGFTPELFEQAMKYALQYSDRYVWIYSQGVNWYTGEGIPSDWNEALASFGQ
jgi:hypothetical protein